MTMLWTIYLALTLLAACVVIAALTVRARSAALSGEGYDEERARDEIARIINQGHGPMLRRLSHYNFDLDAIDPDTVALLRESWLLPLTSSTKQLINERLSTR